MDKNLTLDFVRVTEDAAIEAAKWVGKGDKEKADDAAVQALRKRLNEMNIHGTVVIGEGERDDAPMLYIGEEVGVKGFIELDIAVDPLEGTTPTAKGGLNAMSVLAIAPKGCILNAPDTYMDKIAVGPRAKGKIDLDASTKDNIELVAKCLNKKVEDMTIIVMDRQRNYQLIKEIRETGARVRLIQDGDVSGAIAPSLPDSGIDMLMGIGAAPEGVLAAAALKTFGGEIQGRLKFRSEEEKQRTIKMKYLDDVHKKLSIDDMVKGDNVFFVATGVTNGEILDGVKVYDKYVKTHSIVTRSISGTIRFIETIHKIE